MTNNLNLNYSSFLTGLDLNKYIWATILHETLGYFKNIYQFECRKKTYQNLSYPWNLFVKKMDVKFYNSEWCIEESKLNIPSFSAVFVFACKHSVVIL